MSKPLLQDAFSLRGRRNRKSFLMGTLMFWFIGVFFIGLGAWNLGLVSGWDWSLALRPEARANIYNSITMISGLVLTLVGLLFFAQIYIVQVSQRLRDIGVSGWWAFLPLSFFFLGRTLTGAQHTEGWTASMTINLLIFTALVLYPGTRGENRYGPDPLLRVNCDDKNSYPVELSKENKSSEENSLNSFFSKLSKRARLVLFGCLIWLVVVPVYVFLFTPYGRYISYSETNHMLSVMFLPTLAVGGLYWIYERFVR